MPITLSPQTTNLAKMIARPHGTSESGLRRWTRDEYYRLGDMNLFGDDRVELLSGDIWEKHTSYLYRWTRKQYDQLIAAGFFDGGRVELLGGLIWDMTGQLTPHATGVRLVTLTLEETFGEGFEVRAQLPVTLPDGTEPEPDVAVAPGTPLNYADHHPRTEEVLLVVEISDSSLVKDRGQKLVAYAQALLDEYWIVNLVSRQLEVYRQPSPAGFYSVYQIYQPGENVEPLNAPGKPVAVADLLPPEPKQKL